MSTPPDLELSDDAAASAALDVLVIGTRPGASGEEADDDAAAVPPVLVGAQGVDEAFDGELASLLALAGAAGAAEEVVKLPTRGAITAPLLLAVGLGPAPAPGPPTAPRAPRTSPSRCAGPPGPRRARSRSPPRGSAPPSRTVDLAAAVEGTVLGAYSFTEYRTAPDGPLRTVSFHGAGDGGAADRRPTSLRRRPDRARRVRRARSDQHPAERPLPRRVRPPHPGDGRGGGVRSRSSTSPSSRHGGYGGVLGVGIGSSRPPRLVRLRHTHPEATKHVALIGKGITFDTGGISIKPAANMDHMTSDMSGAACVVATVCLAAELNLPVNVTATVPMAENMPSGTAYRPGDVLTMYGGKTVEVLNTDAEGRLILGDAIARACEDGPDYLVETSTLTGAQTVALGSRTAGIMGSEDLRDRVAAAAAAVGEGGWAMPLPQELRGDLDSRVADIANVTGHRFGGMLVAGIFLREFVADGVPWAHIDIAGPSFNTGGPHGYTPKGGTGLPVRTLTAVLADVARDG